MTEPTIGEEGIEGMTTTRIDHEVTFDLGTDEQMVVKARGVQGYVKVDLVKVTLRADGKHRVFAMGRRCKADGGQDRRMGNVCESVDLDDADAWTSRAALATQRAPDEELGRTVIDNRGIAWHLHDRRIAQPDYGGRCWFCPIATPPDDGTGQ